MLYEALEYLTTPCPSHFKSMGYLKELIATEARYKRCRTAWHPHLEKTKSVIRDAIDVTAGRAKAVVLGAGILSDIPIHALTKSFDQVVLIDVCFLKQTRKGLREFTNIELLNHDITGIAEAVYAGAVPDPRLPNELSLSDADLVISANILSQLPLIPTDYLQKVISTPTEEILLEFSHGIVANHLALLETCPGTVCLISEVERQFFDGDHIIKTEDLLHGYELQMHGTEWLWDLAPKGEVSKDYAIRNRVVGGYWQNSNKN